MNPQIDSAELLPTRCPYTFRVIPSDAVASEYVDPEEFPLPLGWQHSGTITFAMAGARTSGKSIYIGVVIKLLEALTVEYGGTFDPADEFTRETYKTQYEEPLFGAAGDNNQRRVLTSTRPIQQQGPDQSRPLIFRLGHLPRKFGPSQDIFVVFRDVAGEDLEAEDFTERMEHLEFFKHAHSVIYLFDPIAVPEVRSLLEGALPLDAVSEAEPNYVLKNVIRAMGDHRPNVALTLAKFDVLNEITQISSSSRSSVGGGGSINWLNIMSNLGAAFRRSGSSFLRDYNQEEGILLHEEVRAILLSLDARQMFNALDQPSTGVGPHLYRCFAVSSLGHSPNGENISESGIAPFRCLDPLRAQFDQFGLFKKD